MSEPTGFTPPERGEFERSPLLPNDYVARIIKVNLAKYPSWNGSSFNGPLKLQYEVMVAPYEVKGGGSLQKMDGSIAEPLSVWLFKKFGVKSGKTGKDHVTPTMVWAVPFYVERGVLLENFVPSKFVLIDKNENEVTDVEVQRRYMRETTMPAPDASEEWKQAYNSTNKLEGHFPFPDLRHLVGSFIGVTLEADTNGYNKVTRFSRVPETFVPDQNVIAEFEAKFPEKYTKLLEARKKKSQQAPADSSPLTEENQTGVGDNDVLVEDVPF